MRFVILFALATVLLPVSIGHQDGGNLVNAVLGNATSNPNAPEAIRIQTHLLTVARRLAAVDSRHLAPGMRIARERNIQRIVAYARAARFPHRPASVPGRVPNFLDADGAVCAVGYLVEQDLGRDTVVEIARTHQFDYVPYIDSPVLARWQATSGLTPLELAMIQPTYGGKPTAEEDSGLSDEDVFDISLMTADVVSSIFNFSYVANGEGNRIWGAVGLFVGALSIAHDQTKDDPTSYLTAGGIVAAAFGATSFGLTIRRAGNDRRVALSPLVRAGDPATRRVGLQARVFF